MYLIGVLNTNYLQNNITYQLNKYDKTENMTAYSLTLNPEYVSIKYDQSRQRDMTFYQYHRTNFDIPLAT